MPFALSSGTREWWVMGQDYKVLFMFPTREEAFNKALAHNKTQAHNKTHNVDAVYVMGLCAKNGAWKEE
jgi:hypothetical protein